MWGNTYGSSVTAVRTGRTIPIPLNYYDVANAVTPPVYSGSFVVVSRLWRQVPHFPHLRGSKWSSTLARQAVTRWCAVLST